MDEKFCNRIALTYSKKLYELPIKQIKRIHDGIETSDFDLELNTKVDLLNEPWTKNIRDGIVPTPLGSKQTIKYTNKRDDDKSRREYNKI